MQVQHLPLASLNLLGLARTRPPSLSQGLCQKPLPSPQSCPAAAAHQRIRPRLLLPTHEAQGPTGAQGHLSTEKPPGFTHRCPRKTPTLTLQRQNPAGPSRPLRAHGRSSPTDPSQRSPLRPEAQGRSTELPRASRPSPSLPPPTPHRRVSAAAAEVTPANHTPGPPCPLGKGVWARARAGTPRLRRTRFLRCPTAHWRRSAGNEAEVAAGGSRAGPGL